MRNKINTWFKCVSFMVVLAAILFSGAQGGQSVSVAPNPIRLAYTWKNPTPDGGKLENAWACDAQEFYYSDVNFDQAPPLKK